MPVICIDFDGVIHSYKSGWKRARNIPNPPVEGTIDWMRNEDQTGSIKTHFSNITGPRK